MAVGEYARIKTRILERKINELDSYKKEYRRYLESEIIRVDRGFNSNDVDNTVGNLSRIGSNIAKCEGAIQLLEELNMYSDI